MNGAPKQPKVSIIIPCFNAESYIHEAIESALAQTYGHLEVIVIDDGSTDHSLEVIKSFGDRIRWETGPNRGGCAARNRAIELAKGELVQFLDSDDILHPDKLDQQVPLVLSEKGALVYCDGAYMDDGPPHPHHVRKDCCEDSVVFMLRGGLPTPAPLHRKTSLKQLGGFREDLPCAQERDLHLRIAAAGYRFQRLPEVLYSVRRTADGVSRDSLRVLDQHLSIAMPVFEELAKSNRLSEEQRRAFAAFLARDARFYLRAKRNDKAEQYFGAARECHSGGGIEDAYGPVTRIMKHLVGQNVLEKIVSVRRKIKRG